MQMAELDLAHEVTKILRGKGRKVDLGWVSDENQVCKPVLVELPENRIDRWIVKFKLAVAAFTKEELERNDILYVFSDDSPPPADPEVRLALRRVLDSREAARR